MDYQRVVLGVNCKLSFGGGLSSERRDYVRSRLKALKVFFGEGEDEYQARMVRKVLGTAMARAMFPDFNKPHFGGISGISRKIVPHIPRTDAAHEALNATPREIALVTEHIVPMHALCELF